MKSLQIRLNEVNEIVQLLCKGNSGCYANRDIIQFIPGTVAVLNTLIAKRNMLIRAFRGRK